MAVRAGILTVLIVVWGGCVDPAVEARDQYVRGKSAYEIYCASCHEIDFGIGPRLKNEVLSTRGTAASLLLYNRRNMPYQAGNTLTPEQYLDITAYLVVRGGFMDSTRVLTERDAGAVSLLTDRR